MGFRKLLCTALPSLEICAGQFSLGRALTQSVQWSACDSALNIPPTLSCAFFEVPLDYQNTSVGTANLALLKANATQERRGTVFMNPGGPGVSGVSALNETYTLLLNQTGGVFDVVSWDPRGVGSLTIPGDVYCFDDADEQNKVFDGTVEVDGIEMTGNFTDPTDIQGLLAQASGMEAKYNELGQRCLQGSTRKYLQYIGSAATARDVVSLADALDGPGSPVNYIGLSYGTLLGSWLIQMFPERVGKVIIDGVVDPVAFSQEDVSLGWSTELSSADDAYKAFFTGCALAGPEVCPLTNSTSQTPLEVNANIQALLQTAHDAFRANRSVPITSGQVRSLLRPTMYTPSGWGQFVNASIPLIEEIKAEGEQNGIGKRQNVLTMRKRQQSVPSSPYSTEAIICSDSMDSQGTNMTDVFNGIIATSQNVSHMFGAAWPFATYYCPFWPVRAVERYEGPFNKTLANPILVIGNTFDPATPFTPGAAAVAAELGDQASLVRLNAFGHTSQAASSSCLSDIIRAYMVNGTRPSGNETVCEVDADFEVFEGVSYADILSNMPSQDV